MVKIELPKGYKLKSGVKYDKDLKRYLWCPEPKDLFYSTYTKEIYQYTKWSHKPDDATGFIVSLDGYGAFKILGKKKVYWNNNIQIRKCVPIETV